MAKIEKSDAEWRQALTPEQYTVCRGKGTEQPFSGAFLNEKRAGTYQCAGCGEALFDSETKYDSGTGWPSFYQPIAAEKVMTESDRSLGMVRAEVMCAACESHLGHVFEDGPPPTGLRYCLNSLALKLALKD